jgi:anti-sigma regulatory factor (Ser/Thr protein kinase)
VPAAVADQAQLIVSELVTNVIRHATGHEATVRLEQHADRLVVAVVDPDSAPPRVTRAALDDEGGRGLHLVDAVADRWGTRTLVSGGKIVWCELLTSEPG